MSRYPEAARQATIKCIGCNAPVVETIEGSYACVECGESPIHSNGGSTENHQIGGDDQTFSSEDHTFGKKMTERPAD